MPRAKLTRPTGNHLLDRLPDSELGKLLVDAQLVSFAAREEVDGIGRDGHPVYFPTSGVFSLLLPMKDGNSVEVAVVDSEGMLGIPIVLGMHADPLRAVAQTDGDCARIPADRFLSVLRGGGVLDSLFRRFLAVSWQTANQTIACNLRHTVKERTCRWMLAVHDRSKTDEFVVTQEILSGMVGSSRQKVSMVAGELQAAGYISYQRGRVRVINRPGLESVSCECYQTLRQAYEFLTS
ncbi:MAG: cyclic nucleotide-binding protein [Gemmataceae bacterium]|nr:cyclic nucleotide-binding protein [Gemmataceae bacterium]